MLSTSKVRDILGPDRDSEFLQSFVRVDLKADSDDDEPYKSVYMQHKPDLTKQMSIGKSESSDKTPRKSKSGTADPSKKPKRKAKDYFDEIYTDKDRAAAVSLGSYDIKQSLSMKRKQDRSKALQMPEEAEPGALFALGMREFKIGGYKSAVKFLSKALELNPTDQNALIARSKCYLLLGDPAKGLQDAETALNADKGNIRAVYQKAEALYFLGQFEHSLMFFYRGLRIRPELNSFRLGVQKTQEAIEKTIGGQQKSSNKMLNEKIGDKQKSGYQQHSNINDCVKKSRPKTMTNKVSAEKRETRKLLGELCVDKEYLENLLKHPDLKRADTGSENISSVAKEAVNFLNTRQEFWRQQRPCTALPKKKNFATDSGVPKWF